MHIKILGPIDSYRQQEVDEGLCNVVDAEFVSESSQNDVMIHVGMVRPRQPGITTDQAIPGGSSETVGRSIAFWVDGREDGTTAGGGALEVGETR